jgi:hypothetical protein
MSPNCSHVIGAIFQSTERQNRIAATCLFNWTPFPQVERPDLKPLISRRATARGSVSGFAIVVSRK